MIQLFDLQSKKVVKFTHHGHLKFSLHSCKKLLTQILISGSKYNIINIQLNQNNIIECFLDKQCLICFSSLICMRQQEVVQPLISLPWGLLQTIQSFLQFEDIIQMFMIFKSRRLTNINFFINIPIKENTFDIHLVKLESIHASIC